MKNPITNTWRKMKSFGDKSPLTTAPITKSKSCNGRINDSKGNLKRESPKQGMFTVYVGPTKQRIEVKTKLLNHPLFKNLLEDAENEYGYIRDGPIVLPCEVDFFFKVLADMKKSNDAYDDDDDGDFINSPICGIRSPYGSYGKGGLTDTIRMRRISSYKRLRNPSLF